MVGGVEKMRPGMKVNPEPYTPPAPKPGSPVEKPEASPTPETKTGDANRRVAPIAAVVSGSSEKSFGD